MLRTTSVDPPRRYVRPCFDHPARPFCCFIGLTACTRVGHLVEVGHLRTNEREGVAANIDIRDRLLDLRHVAIDAIASWTAGSVMRMFGNSFRSRAVYRARTVARQTKV